MKAGPDTMIWTSFIAVVFFTSFTTGAAVDNEPPVINCPSDIILKDVVNSEERVNWDRANATDNSGVPPIISSTQPNGDLFDVPGTYEIVYTAEDDSGNKATCSFRITLERKQCPLYPAPHFGALACRNVGSDRVCAVMCKSTLDFTSDPPQLYYCSQGEWNTFSIFPFSSSLPWPDCSVRADPSSLKSQFPSYYFFSGDVSDPSVTEVIRGNFFNILTSSFVPPFFCQGCTKESIEVFPGNVSDSEPPVITCPSDIVQNDLTVTNARVAWDRPYATDNSGDQPSLTSTRPNGDLFDVPGTYEIVYTARDWSGNKATCSFSITLEKKTCPLYPPPANGALACTDTGADPGCTAMCRTGFDFNAPVAFLYLCNSGVWQTISFNPGVSLPWPNCTASSGNLQMGAFPEFYYSDANDPSVVDTEIKNNFITLLQAFNLCPQWQCPTEESVKVYLG